MRKAKVYMQGVFAGVLTEEVKNSKYKFEYASSYKGEPVSNMMPVEDKVFIYNEFPPFFEGLLPEGILLEGLLKIRKIDRTDDFSQLLAVGEDMVGAVTVKPYEVL